MTRDTASKDIKSLCCISYKQTGLLDFADTTDLFLKCIAAVYIHISPLAFPYRDIRYSEFKTSFDFYRKKSEKKEATEKTM